jgi:hypothetical protein
MENLELEVEQIRANTISDTSRALYYSSMCRFLMFLWTHHPELLTNTFVESVNTDQQRPLRDRILDYLRHPIPLHDPIAFDFLTAKIFMTWLVTMKKPDGSLLSYSSYNGHRTGLFNLFRNYKKRMSEDLSNELTHHFRGLKRKIAKSLQGGEGNIKVGKEPLSFGLYRFLGISLMTEASKEFTFAHAFMTICWNLMCRSSNALQIHYQHMQWSDDALCIIFAHMKNDQTGERPRDPRHIYPNPDKPEICPILSLALYWATNSIETGASELFPGNNQYDRFRKILSRAVHLDTVATELERLGLEAGDLGTHSMRKGAATFCSSGSTACPSSSAIHLRAGWTLGGVQDSYIRYEAAGDMYVGRTLSGLPQDKAQFAAVGPYFEPCKLVDDAVRHVFPNLPGRLQKVGEHALASLVYHSDFVLQTIKRNHPARLCHVYRSRALLEVLKPLAKVSLPGDESGRYATGVPPHISLLNQMKHIEEEIKRVIPALNDSVASTISGLVRELEERAIGARTVTTDGLKAMLEGTLQQVLENYGLNPSNQPVDANNPPPAQEGFVGVHMWGGALHLLPENYVLPNGTCEAAWQVWMLPDTMNQHPPLKQCVPSDFAQKTQRKRFSDLTYLAKDISRYITDGVVINSINQVNEIFYQWLENLDLPLRSNKGRRRRMGQMKWASMVTLLRKHRQQP